MEVVVGMLLALVVTLLALVVPVILWLLKRLATTAAPSSGSRTPSEPSSVERKEEEEVGKEEKAEFEYDVFLSFRGEDTRKVFTGHLHSALENRGIRTFIDDQNLEKGEEIRKLLGYIERSKIFVPIFSKRYAESKWCLMELVQMVDCGRLILPIFYDVDPSHVRSGPFQDAFQGYTKKNQNGKEEVQRWRDALRTVGERSGYVLQTETHGHEAKLIQIIIKRILRELNKAVFDVAKHPVGIIRRVKDVIALLDIESADVRLVGIQGIGGIGKTTLAKAIFNRISPSFEVCCFLSNVREECKQVNGLVSLQKRILAEATRDENPAIYDASHGSKRIREVLAGRSTLLVIDDADDESQLDALAGGEEWFGPKSRIIVTTRSERVLESKDQIVNWQKRGIYCAQELNDDESLQLFTYHAFASLEVSGELQQLAKEVVAATHGIPLILEVYGSIFFDKTCPSEWEAILKELKNHQQKKVHESLRISFDVLATEEKQILLDIAFFFTGERKEEPFYFWDGCEFFPYLSVQTLLHRSLIKIDEANRFQMHDELRHMAREIVRQEDPSHPSKRSRLVLDGKEEMLGVLGHHDKGVENVQCIRLMWEDLVSTGELESLATLTNLRMLQIKGKIDNHVQLPRHLKWLDLERASIDDSSLLHLTELVILRLVNVRSGELLPFNKSLDKLEVLVLDNWGELIASPDFNYFPNLKKLEYIGCSGVKKVAGHVMNRFMDLLMLQITRRRTCWEEIPATVGNLTSLRELRIRGASIQGLPDSITQLPNLTDLSLSECFRLKKLPDAMGCLTALSTLDLGRCTALEDLPDSIGELQSLKTLELRGTKFKRLPDFIGSLKRLSQLDLSSCDVWEDLPDSIGQLESLKTLKLGGTKFERLPDFIGSLKRLSQLDLSGCDVLEEIPDSIAQLSNLTDLSLENCGRLKKLPDAMGCLTALSTLNLRGCTTLEDLPDSIRTLKTLKRLDFYGNDIDGAKEPPLINLR